MNNLLDCAWRGVKWTAFIALLVIAALGITIFVSWNFSHQANGWAVIGRALLVVWVYITCLFCADKRGGMK
jgi:membrane protein YdbS with pleckstrin-like domain